MHSIHIKITELWFIQSAIDLSFITFDRINLKNSTKANFSTTQGHCVAILSSFEGQGHKQK